MRRDEQERRLALARCMRRTGLPLEIPEDDAPVSCRSEVGLIIRVSRGAAVQLNPYFSAFHIWVKIISNRTLPFHIDDFRLELPWRPENLSLLPDPAEQEPPRSAYKFGGMTSWSFPRGEVLNHLRNHSFELRRGRPVQGYLLWLANGEIPKEFSSKALMPAMISVVDQYGSPYETTAPLLVTRLRWTLPVRRSGRNITGRVHADGPAPEPQETEAGGMMSTIESKGRNQDECSIATASDSRRADESTTNSNSKRESTTTG